MNKTVDIIILSYNTRQYTQKCLETIQKFTDLRNVRVCVVDNNSTRDDSKEYLQSLKWIDLTLSPENLGFSKGCNVYMRNSTADYVLLLNSDIEITQPNWIETLVAIAESDQSIGIVGCKLLYPDSRIQHAGGYIKPGWEVGDNCGDHFGRFLPSYEHNITRVDCDYVTGACFLVKKALKDKIGPLNEKWFFGVEDVDYCHDAKKAGFKVLYTPKVSLIHHESVSHKLEKAFQESQTVQ